LVELVDSQSIKIGDTAADLLGSRNEAKLVIDALMSDRLRTADGRVRATNTLHRFGRSVPESADAHVRLLGDRSDRVVRNALFGIVFMCRRDLLPKLKGDIASAPAGTTRHNDLRDAIVALEANDPFIFSPGFEDQYNVWRLRPGAPSRPPKARRVGDNDPAPARKSGGGKCGTLSQTSSQ
jgi:hypothetical protein